MCPHLNRPLLSVLIGIELSEGVLMLDLDRATLQTFWEVLDRYVGPARPRQG